MTPTLLPANINNIFSVCYKNSLNLHVVKEHNLVRGAPKWHSSGITLSERALNSKLRTTFLKRTTFNLKLTADNSNPRELEARASSNQYWFPLELPLSFTVILRSITRTLDNSTLPIIIRSYPFFHSHLFSIILPLITRTLSKVYLVKTHSKNWIWIDLVLSELGQISERLSLKVQ